MQHARSHYNWQCADLAETFTNLRKLKWDQPIQPGGPINQLALDLLRRIHAADGDRFIIFTARDANNNNYGVIPLSNNPMDLVFLKHQATTEVVPNQSHIMEYFEDAKECVHDLTGIIDKLNAEIRLLKITTNWTTRLPQEGANRAYISTLDMDTIKEFIKRVESEDQDNSMLCHYYAANN
jgi:hypothetical protein